TELLSRVPLFSGCSLRETAAIGRAAKEVHRRQGSVLARTGEAGVGFFLLVDGQASVLVNGRKRTTLEAGDFFGEISLLEGRSRRAPRRRPGRGSPGSRRPGPPRRGRRLRERVVRRDGSHGVRPGGRGGNGDATRAGGNRHLAGVPALARDHGHDGPRPVRAVGRTVRPGPRLAGQTRERAALLGAVRAPGPQDGG